MTFASSSSKSRQSPGSKASLARRLIGAAAALGLAALPHGSNAQVPGTFDVVNENSLASAMMLGLANQDTVLILDKAENNSYRLNDGRPVWGAFFDLNDNGVRGVDITTNTFCASGATLGNGTWLVAGGNQPVGYGGAAVPQNISPYSDYDGTQALRLLEPQTNSQNLQWLDSPASGNVNMMQTPRWYPGIEVLEDGSVILIGGAVGGGYINRNYPNDSPGYQGGSFESIRLGGANPTYEYFPTAGKPALAECQFMFKTGGLNMYAHTFLMPSGKIFMQANYSTVLWDHINNVETDLPDMPGQIVRVYPASGATAMMPLTSQNNYTPTILFCGGSSLPDASWGNYSGPSVNILGVDASKDCTSITPELADGTRNPDVAYQHEEDLPEGRSMGQFIHLPDGTMVIVNGCSKGTAGYGNATFNTVNPGSANPVNTEGFCQDPTYTPVLYDPSKPMGSRLSTKGFSPSNIARLYHSSAILIPDGSVLIAGSNPHQDVVLNMPTNTIPQAFNTTYEIEKFYPAYYNEPRPYPQGVPDWISYGGASFDITVNGTFMGDSANAKAATTKFGIIRPGFSTHAMNMGQRAIYLDYTYVVNDDASVTYTVNPLPATKEINRLFVPGPALFFVTVAGVPSHGKYIMVGVSADNAPVVPFTAAMGSALQTLAAPVNSTKFTASLKSSNDESSWDLGKIIGIAGAGAAALALLILGFCLWKRRSNRNQKANPRHSAAPWSSRDIGMGSEYKRVDTPAGSINGAFGTHPSDSRATFESYHMQGVTGTSESKEALSSGYYDHPRGASQGTQQSYQSNPLANNGRGGYPAQYQQQGWGEHHAGDAGAYYEDNADRYGGNEDHMQHYYDQPSHDQQRSYNSHSQSYSGSYAR